jgi:hypothetical protein
MSETPTGPPRRPPSAGQAPGASGGTSGNTSAGASGVGTGTTPGTTFRSAAGAGPAAAPAGGSAGGSAGGPAGPSSGGSARALAGALADAPSSPSALHRQLLQSLAAVANARTLYPAGHPRVLHALGQLERDLAAGFATGTGEVTLLVVDEELVVAGEAMPNTILAAQSLVRALHRLGIERLTLAQGVSRDELDALLGALAGQRPPRPSPHVILGRVVVAEVSPGARGDGGGAGRDAEAETVTGAGSGAGRGAGANVATGTGAGSIAAAGSAAGSSGASGASSLGGSGSASPHAAAAGADEAGRDLAGDLGSLTELPIDGLEAGLALLRTDLREGFRRLDRLVWQLMEATSRESRALVLLAEMRGHHDRLFRHAVNVSLWTLGFARALDLDAGAHHDLALAGLLHDVGLLELPPELVFSRGARSEPQRRLLQTHPVRGAIRLAGIPDMPTLPILVAYEHHVRHDGQGGYPSLRRRPDFAARLVAVVDTWDMLHAATAGHPTPNRRRWVAEGLRQRAGTLLDPELVTRFLELLAAANGPSSPGAASS